MRLRDLEAEFVRILDERTYRRVESIDEADGVLLLCPKCFTTNSGPVGTHYILCWRPRVGQEWKPGPGRWEFLGTGIDDLELRAGSSSILLTSGCQWHGFIRNGETSES